MKNREIGTKRNKFKISVVVLDLKTKQSYEYKSISEAARFLNTYPKTIWRIVYNNKLYLNRYQITEKSLNQENVEIFKVNIHRYLYFILNIIKSNKILIYRTFFCIVLVILILIIITFIFVVYKNIYDQYLFTFQEGKVNYNKCVLEHKLYLKNVLNNNTNIINYKCNINKSLKYEDVFNNNLTPIYNTRNKLGIYETIIKEINLDFSKSTGTFTDINSTYSSPIIERVNINTIFKNAISSNNHTKIVSNPLGLFFEDLTIDTKVKPRELLNYESNILYCLINGLSPISPRL